MKRAFYEWGAITNLAMAILCFGYWAVSVATPRIDFEVFLPLGHWSSTQVVASGGTVTINDHRGSKEEIEDVSRYRVINPPLTSKLRRVLPGFVYQSINWGGQLTWSIQLSLLIPTGVMTLAAAFFIRGYLRARRDALRVFLSKSSQRTTVRAAGAS